MRADYYYDSCGIGQIRAGVWEPEEKPVAVVQIVHGIAEHIQRYDDFAHYLNENGILVVAEDHMGHGRSIGSMGIRGYFHGGWHAAVEDTFRLTKQTMARYPGVPYILFGHSMGSFMVRTLLSKHPDSGIHGCIICGTAWQPKLLLKTALLLAKVYCRDDGDKKPCPALQKLMFGSYNQRIEHVRTQNDWLTRDSKVVDAYEEDPLCGFVATAGLYSDMLNGIAYIQERDNLSAMNKELPILFTGGNEDPVGAYGKGIRDTAHAFSAAGMQNVTVKTYPLCRHEILNEINKAEVYRNICEWILKRVINTD